MKHKIIANMSDSLSVCPKMLQKKKTKTNAETKGTPLVCQHRGPVNAKMQSSAYQQ